MKKAFTLLELMVSLFLFTVIVMAIYSVMITASRYLPIDLELLTLQQQARQAAETISRELREATLNSVVITPVDTQKDMLIFSTPDKNGITYSLNNNGHLVRENPPGTQKIIAHSLTGMKFSRTGHLITTKIRTARSLTGQPLVFDYWGKVRVRNDD